MDRVRGQKPLLALALLTGVLIGGAAVGLITRPSANPDAEPVKWRLIEVAAGGRALMVLPRGSLGPCEWNEASTGRLASGAVRISVVRKRWECGTNQPLVHLKPVPLRVDLPVPRRMRGQAIGGPGYDGVAPTVDRRSPKRAVPRVVGMQPKIATELLVVNDLIPTRSDRGSAGVVTSQSLSARSVKPNTRVRLAVD